MLERQEEFTMEREYPLETQIITGNKVFALIVQNQLMKPTKEAEHEPKYSFW